MTPADRRAPSLAAVLSMVLALSVCGGEPAGEPPSQGFPAETVPAPEPPVASLFEEPSDDVLPVTLEAVDDSGVEGRATAIHMADSIRVNLMVQGLPSEGEYAAHIHRGTCESGGGVAVPLNPVRADADGMGRSETVFSGDRLSQSERYYVQVHGPAGAIACGDVQGHGGV